jgi:hypothetical protein
MEGYSDPVIKGIRCEGLNVIWNSMIRKPHYRQVQFFILFYKIEFQIQVIEAILFFRRQSHIPLLLPSLDSSDDLQRCVIHPHRKNATEA